MNRFRLTLEYDGAGFSGWQIQPRQETVQGVLEEALLPLCQESVRVIGSGRTDAGVHALEQVAHFDTSAHHDAAVYLRALNATTPRSVTVHAVSEVSRTFDARRSARYREYLYRIVDRPNAPALDRHRVWHQRRRLDLERMQAALSLCRGKHDFSSFRAAACQAKHPVRTVRRAEIRRSGDDIAIILGADAFLHHMVRNIVGTLVPVGLGRLSVERFSGILHARDRKQAGATAPPHGLYLRRVLYD
ncbi:MAG: tRNA pseudouridine(38-40) synthase TruA [Magnetococcales bacterium]|nr:tRNA pseudouridine(38-40) synthase TruA [Magnetococcales bacterium]